MDYVIKFCENNFVHGTGETARRLREEDNYEVMITSCLGNCSDCIDMPYAVVKDTLIYADDADSLYDEIMDAID
ncbi:YuzB family protein [Irregularibacter muris]|uniref:YuzB family protein n=1 Tax=Irregularibacter muris TaxID=1796619 RepID=A0AAE3HEM9_9FIRM|nr:YuzB family protein [Irregularibacter muris]MCR1897754.1 YuzB family protein [Irregularibacter muris]